MRFKANGALRRIVGRLHGQASQRAALTRLGAAVLLVVVLAIGVTVWDLRRIALADAWTNTDNLAIVLAEQTSRSVQAVDIVLRDIQDRIAALGVTTPDEFRLVLRTEAMHDFMRSRADRLPQVDNIALVGADGIRVNYSIGWPAPPGNMSDRDYFHHFGAQDDRGVFISEPVINRATYVWSVYMARRVSGPQGDFLGIVLASVPLRVFSDLYHSMTLPAGESLALLRRDGTLLARHPDPIDRAGTKMPPGSDWYARVAEGGGHYDSPGYFDGIDRLVVARPLQDYPLVMDATIARETALAHWQREATLIAIGTICASGSLLLLLRALARQFRRLEAQRSALQGSEAALAATSRELETTLASMDQGLVMVDARGAVAVCNRRAIQLFDLPAALMATRPDIDAVAPLRFLSEALSPLDLTGADAAQDRGPYQVYEQILPNGQIVEVRSGPVAGGGGWMATIDDITARRHAEQQAVFAKAESRAKSGFLAMMSHEIRTPMNGVLGLAGSLLDSGLTDHQALVVAAIQESGNALLRILNDILDFSKLDAGQMQLEEAPFSPATLTEDPVSLLGPAALGKGLDIRAVSEPGLPAALLGDAGRLRQVLLNLVSNAIKFTPRGTVTVRAACPAQDEQCATMVWTVTDSGIGIPAERIAGLFREFFQADASITRKFGGSGLGLAISKRLIEQMGGTISVRSQPGEGSTFEITLRLPVTEPMQQTAAAPVDAAAAFADRLRLLGRSARILLAEDNPTNQFVIQQLLRSFEVQVDVAANGLEAVQAAAGLPYDVICMDMRMPEMDGLAATRAIRAMGGRLAAVPIIALTANAFPEDVAACSEAGMTGFLAKPVTKQALLTALLAVFDPVPLADPVAPPAAASGGAEPAIDREGLAQLTEDIGADGVSELTAMFAAETRARLDQIADGALDPEALIRAMHSLKGTAASACAVALSRRAAALEIQLKQGIAIAPADVSALREAFDAWCGAVQEIEVREAMHV